MVSGPAALEVSTACPRVLEAEEKARGPRPMFVTTIAIQIGVPRGILHAVDGSGAPSRSAAVPPLDTGRAAAPAR